MWTRFLKIENLVCLKDKNSIYVGLIAQWASKGFSGGGGPNLVYL